MLRRKLHVKMAFQAAQGAFGIVAQPPPTSSGGGDADGTNTTANTNQDSPKKRSYDEMKGAEETDREGELEKTLDERRDCIKKIILLMRRNPDLKPRTFKDLEINLKDYTRTELDEIYENLIYDIQAGGGTPVGEFTIFCITYPFSNSVPLFKKYCMEDDLLKRDLELEISQTFATITPRIMIIFKFVNHFMRALGYYVNEVAEKYGAGGTVEEVAEAQLKDAEKTTETSTTGGSEASQVGKGQNNGVRSEKGTTNKEIGKIINTPNQQPDTTPTTGAFFGSHYNRGIFSK